MSFSVSVTSSPIFARTLLLTQPVVTFPRRLEKLRVKVARTTPVSGTMRRALRPPEDNRPP
jgi:hypothetical protein